MVSKPFTRVLICLAVLALIGVSALAVGSKSQFLTTNDGRMAIATHPPQHITPSNQDDAKLTKIGGNLSTYPFATYFCCYGNTIAEGGSSFPFQTWVAVAFTPTADATVTKVEASVGTFGGASGFELS